MIEIIPVGGYSEVGRNMTAVKVDNEIVILDMGINLPKIVDFEEEGGDRTLLTNQHLIQLGAIPNDKILDSLRKEVKAIILSHCHLDHLASTPFLARNYPNAPILATPFTLEVLKNTLRSENIQIPNKFISLNTNSKYSLTNSIEVEFINITHSTLQTVLIAIHTKYGTLVYANDFKFDNSPVLGKKPNYKRIKELGNNNVIALIMECLYSHAEQKTPSEKVAREMLKDVMLGTESAENLIIATTFASHLARLKSIIEFGNILNRKIVFLGQSLMKYTLAAEKLNLVNYSKKVEIVPYAKQIKRKLREVEKEGRASYLLICTGNQGEPNSVLSKMVDGRLEFNFLPQDHVIFSSRVIPHPTNIKNREKLDSSLKKRRVRIFSEIHVSGHASKEDQRDFINMLKPKHIIPTHGPEEKQLNLAELAIELGYQKDKTVHLLSNGKRLVIQ